MLTGIASHQIESCSDGRVGFVTLVGIPLNGPMLLRSFYSHFSIGGRVGFVTLVGIPLNGPMLFRSFYSHFSIGGRVGFVALVGIPLNGPMLLRSLYSDFSIGCLDSPERCAVTPSLSIHAIMCLSSRWWCPGPDDDSLVETNTHTLIIDFTALRHASRAR